MSLLERMSVSPDSLTFGEKLIGSIQVTIFGLVIVFLALGVLYFCITAMNRVLNPSEKEKPQAVAPVKIEEPKAVAEESEDEGELVAVLTAAIAATLNTTTHSIVVRNIIRHTESTPAWGKLGRMENLNRWQ